MKPQDQLVVTMSLASNGEAFLVGCVVTFLGRTPSVNVESFRTHDEAVARFAELMRGWSESAVEHLVAGIAPSGKPS